MNNSIAGGLREKDGRILIVCTTDLGTPTASSIHVLSLARAFKRFGKTIVLFAESKPDTPTDFDVHSYTIRISKNRRWKSIVNAFLQLLYFLYMTRKFRAVDFEMIYVRASSITLPFTIMSKCFLRGPVVTEHNGWIADEGQLLGLPNWMTWLQGKVQIWDAKFSNMVRAVTDGLKELLVEKGIDPEKIAVIGNGTDTDHFRPVTKASACEQFMLDPNLPIVGFIGNLVPWQGVERLLDAIPYLLQRVPRAHVVIGGGGLLLDSLKQRAEALGVADAVTFFGWVPYAQANDFVCCCDVTVASFIEARNYRIGLSPLKIRDYASAGRATIASNAPGISQLAEFDFLVTCNTADPRNFAQAIGDLLDRPDKRAEMSRAGRLYAEQHFHWNGVAEDLLMANAANQRRR